MTPDDPRHGTNRGYRAHRVANQPACDPCKKAAAAYQATLKWELMQGKPPRLVDAQGTRRRLQALYAIGWTGQHIADTTGIRQPQVTRISSGRAQKVTQATAAAITKAYAELSGKPGPSNLNRVAASRKNWAPPLAWDDIDNDPRPVGARWEPRGCGTRFGYTAHWHAGEPACRPCLDAHAAHARERARTANQTRRNTAA